MPSEQPQDEKDYVKFGDGYEDRLKRLKSIAEELLPHYGAHWHKHTSNVMRVEAMARLLYLQSLYLKILDVPGETLALNDVLGLNNLRRYRTSIQTHCAWMIWGE